MKKAFILTVFITLFVYPSTSFANENGLLLPPLAGFNEFTVNSNSEIELHNGEIFIQGMTKCLKTD